MSYTYGSVTNCKVRNGQTRTEYQCRLGYEVQSQSIENNTSTVKLRLECRSISSSYTTKGSSGLTSIIDGSTVKSNAAVDMSSTNTWQNFGERTITITHNADGTYSANKSGSFTCTAGSSNYSLASGSASVTVAPATIPRASSFGTITGNTIGSGITINIDRKSSNFTHSLWYSFGSLTWQGIASGVETSASFTPPLSICSQIPNSTSGTMTLILRTYNGSTQIGSDVTKTITVNVPSSVVPSISSISLSAGNSVIPSSWGVYVKGKSQLKVVTSASGSYGSTIKSYKITGIDNNTYWSSNFTSGILQSSGTKTITVTITDSRGRTATKTTTYTCVDYSNPSVTTATVTRCNSDGTDNEEGTYVKYTFKASVASVSNKNTYSYRLGYKNSTSGSYTYITISNSAYSLDKSNVIIEGVTFSVDNSYDFQFLVNDYFTSTSVIKNIGTGFTLMDFNASGKGMAIGKVSEKNALEINLSTDIKKDLKHSNAYVHTAESGQGSGGYIKWAEIKIEQHWINQPIEFVICRRSSRMYSTISLLFRGVDSYDPTLDYFTIDGTVFPVYIYKADAGTWHLYFQKADNYENFSVASYHKGTYLYNVNVTFVDVFASSLPSGCIQASTFSQQIETITNSNGTAIKYPDGTLICTNKIENQSYPITQAWGSIFETPNTSTAGATTFPVAFVSKPALTASQIGNLSGGMLNDLYYDNTKITRVNFRRPTSATSSLSYSYIAIGRWK